MPKIWNIAALAALSCLALVGCEQKGSNVASQTKRTVEGVQDAIADQQQRTVDAADEIMGLPKSPADSDGDGIPDEEDPDSGG